MPRIWNRTIAAHKSDVRDAVLDAVDRIVVSHGFGALTMTGVAGEAGIGRATLYKYYGEIEQVLGAWRDRTIGRHVRELGYIAASMPPGPPAVLGVLAAYVRLSGTGGRAGAPSHGGAHGTGGPVESVVALLSGLIEEGQSMGSIRMDAQPDLLARYCMGVAEAAKSVESAPAATMLSMAVRSMTAEEAYKAPDAPLEPR